MPAFLGLLCGACQPGFYSQAAMGQAEILRKARPSGAVIGDPTTDPAVRDRLELTRRLLAFAESELLLPNDGNFTCYADLGREYVLWSVFAAPEFDVEAIEWTYPIFGSLAYRGYFKEADAEAFAAKQRAKGLDTAVVPVPAYSSLGWFRDPVLNTFVDYDEADFAALIFHELAHKKYYRHGDTEFSEAFAVAVEHEGVRRWLKSTGDHAALAEYEAENRKLLDFVRRFLKTRDALRELYASGLPEPEMRARKQQLLAEIQTPLQTRLRAAGKTAEDTFWLRGDLNNAHLNVIAAYFLRVPEFEELIAASGGNLAEFFKRVESVP